jgi:four helix bundle protein
MAFKFENLRIWQESMELAEEINTVADNFPKKEFYNLSSQIRRAADSIALNIAEGSTGLTNMEQKRFLIMANRSVLEVVTCLVKANTRKYLDLESYCTKYKKCESLSRMIQAFIKKLI